MDKLPEHIHPQELADVPSSGIPKNDEHWGAHLLVDMSGCKNLNDKDTVRKFIKELVPALKMKPIGEPIIVQVNDKENGRGTSAIQLITTSSITYHSDLAMGDCIYLDVFACKEYDAKIVFKLIDKYFEPKRVGYKFFYRDAGGYPKATKKSVDSIVKTPSELNHPAFLMNFPFTVDNDEPNNVWMAGKKDEKYNYEKAFKQFLDLYHYIAEEALIYLLPSEGDYPDQTYVANLGAYLPHILEPTVVIANFRSKPRIGEDKVGKKFFKSMGYNVYQSPYKWEGEADTKYIRNNLYVGGYGIRTDKRTYSWMENTLRMNIIPVKMTDEKLYHFDCLSKDSLIATNKGLVSIASLNNFSDYSVAVSFDNHIGPINFWADKGEQDVIEIKTELGNRIKSTLNHKFEVFDQNIGGTCWKTASQLTTNDYLIIPTNSIIRSEPLLLNLTDPDKIIKKPWRAKPVNRLYCMTADLSYIIGLLLAEGHLGNRYARTKGIRISNSNLDIVNKFSNKCLELFGRSVSITATKPRTNIINNHPGCTKIEQKEINYAVSFCSVVVFNWMKELGVKDVYSMNKEVPWSILQADYYSQCSFIAGLIDGDGGFSYNQARINSSSIKLLEQVQLILFTHGIISRIRLSRKDPEMFSLGFNLKNGSHDISRFTIKKVPDLSGLKEAQGHGIPVDLLTNVVKSKFLDKRNSVLTYKKLGSNQDNYLGIDIKHLSHRPYFAKIESIVSIGKEHVYDISVPNYNRFIANGISVHNCIFAPLSDSRALVATSVLDAEDVKAIEDVVEIIDIPKDCVYNGWTNVLMLGNKVLHAPPSDADPDVNIQFREFMYKIGYEPILIDLSEFEKSGADLSCMFMHLNYCNRRVESLLKKSNSFWWAERLSKLSPAIKDRLLVELDTPRIEWLMQNSIVQSNNK